MDVQCKDKILAQLLLQSSGIGSCLGLVKAAQQNDMKAGGAVQRELQWTGQLPRNQDMYVAR